MHALGLVGRHPERPLEQIGMYSTIRVGSTPHDAGDQRPADGSRRCASASSWAAKPPKTTEWTAPSRAQASIATTASGTIGM